MGKISDISKRERMRLLVRYTSGKCQKEHREPGNTGKGTGEGRAGDKRGAGGLMDSSKCCICNIILHKSPTSQSYLFIIHYAT